MRPYLRAANVTWDGLDLSDVNEMNFPPEQLETFRLQAEDILLSEASGSASEVGKPALWRGQIENCCFQNTLIRVRSCGPDPRYLLLHFKADAELGRFSKAARGVGIHHLGAKAMEEWPLRLAPFGEQLRIVDEVEKQFTRLDAAVAGLQRVKANLKRYRASVLKAACEGRLVPSEAELARREGRSFESGEELLKRILKERRARWEADQLAKMTAAGRLPSTDGWKAGYREPRKPEKDGAPLPEGWAYSTVETVGDVLLGRQRAPQYQTGRWTRPYLRVANVKDDRLDFRDVETMDFDPVHFEKYRLVPGDILVSEGQSPERVGESAVYRGGIDGLCFQKTLHRFRPVPGGPSSGFAQIVFRTHVKTGVFMRLASITTNIAHLTLEKFEAAPFPLPPLAEQHRIVAEVERRLSVVDELEATVEKNLARCARLRQSILKMAFEGRLVPQDPNDEPASVLLDRIREERGPEEPRRRGVRRAPRP
jgi:type I restriction enzyme S subunit